MNETANAATVECSTGEQVLHVPSASNPPTLPQFDPSTDELSNTQADGNQDAQQHPRRSGSEDSFQQVEPNLLKVWPCGCDEAPNHYLENFGTFQRHVRVGLKNLTSRDVHYDRIEALMVYWKGGDVPEVAQNASELGDLFRKAPYEFAVTPHEIDYRNLSQDEINDAFRDTLRAVQDRLKDKKSEDLLILYYGGHGVVDLQTGDRLWQPKKSSAKYLIWSDYQSTMYGFECDILYLFDCCYSLAMVENPSTRSRHKRRCEILCSSGLKEQSGAQNKTVFTGALTKLLVKKRDDIHERKDAIGGLTFESICDRMTKKEIRDSLIAEPRWQVVSPNAAIPGRITLAKKGVETITPQIHRDDSDSGYESQVESRGHLSDTRILIKIRLTDAAKGLSSDDWLKWFEQRPHNVARIDIAVVKKIEWVGVFESDSSLALITMPLWLWHNMERGPACESLGIVRSENLLRRPVKQNPEILSFSPLPLCETSTKPLMAKGALSSFSSVPLCQISTTPLQLQKQSRLPNVKLTWSEIGLKFLMEIKASQEWTFRRILKTSPSLLERRAQQ